MALANMRVLGWVVIAHGLSHAVLPLRDSLSPGFVIDDGVPVGLYVVGMTGFVAAGLGLLGLRPFDRAISPLLVLASGLSLVAVVRFADPTLWFGAACDVVLLGLGLWRAYGGWPEHPVDDGLSPEPRVGIRGAFRRVRAATLHHGAAHDAHDQGPVRSRGCPACGAGALSPSAVMRRRRSRGCGRPRAAARHDGERRYGPGS